MTGPAGHILIPVALAAWPPLHTSAIRARNLTGRGLLHYNSARY